MLPGVLPRRGVTIVLVTGSPLAVFVGPGPPPVASIARPSTAVLMMFVVPSTVSTRLLPVSAAPSRVPGPLGTPSVASGPPSAPARCSVFNARGGGWRWRNF